MNARIETLSRWELAEAMFNRTNVDVNGHTCVIHRIELEDGSGLLFNVLVVDIRTRDTCTVFVNTRKRSHGQCVWKCGVSAKVHA